MSSSPAVVEPAPKTETLKMENTQKRDTLIADEIRFQEEWNRRKLFESNAPESASTQQDKFFATTAYPYMNGRLHAGHAFTWSKVEFMTGFARMQGKNALMPQGYHCTGMPIKAAADKLAREVELFGTDFEGADTQLEALQLAEGEGAAESSKADIGKFSGSKSKATAKTVKAKYQFQVCVYLVLFASHN